MQVYVRFESRAENVGMQWSHDSASLLLDARMPQWSVRVWMVDGG